MLSGKSGQLREKVNNMVKYSREQFFIYVNDMLDNEVKSNPSHIDVLQKKIIGISNSSSMPFTEHVSWS